MSDINAGIKMFPDPSSVFANNVEEHSKYLFPLFSIELSVIDASWQGSVHMLQFNEDPYNRETVKTFNEYCKEYMIAFDVIDGKYSFKTDFSYFSLQPDWVEWFEKTKATYNQTKEFYLANGKLPERPYGGPSNIYEQVGGEPEWIQGDETPLDPEGKPMKFICGFIRAITRTIHVLKTYIYFIVIGVSWQFLFIR